MKKINLSALNKINIIDNNPESKPDEENVSNVEVKEENKISDLLEKKFEDNKKTDVFLKREDQKEKLQDELFVSYKSSYSNKEGDENNETKQLVEKVKSKFDKKTKVLIGLLFSGLFISFGLFIGNNYIKGNILEKEISAEEELPVVKEKLPVVKEELPVVKEELPVVKEKKEYKYNNFQEYIIKKYIIKNTN